MPAFQVFELMNEKRKQENERELWRRYVSLVAQAFGADPYEKVLEDYRERTKPRSVRREEIQDGYKVAQETIKALEKCRG